MNPRECAYKRNNSIIISPFLVIVILRISYNSFIERFIRNTLFLGRIISYSIDIAKLCYRFE